MASACSRLLVSALRELARFDRCLARVEGARESRRGASSGVARAATRPVRAVGVNIVARVGDVVVEARLLNLSLI